MNYVNVLYTDGTFERIDSVNELFYSEGHWVVDCVDRWINIASHLVRRIELVEVPDTEEASE